MKKLDVITTNYKLVSNRKQLYDYNCFIYDKITNICVKEFWGIYSTRKVTKEEKEFIEIDFLERWCKWAKKDINNFRAKLKLFGKAE